MSNNLPTTQDLFVDNIEDAFRDEHLNALLNKEPKKEWIKEHPFVKGHRYIPIDKVEFMLRKIFKQVQIQITGQGTAFNGVWVTVRVNYLHPNTGEMSYHDGIGACQLQTKQGSSPADLANINNGALSMAFPIAKTLAIKDACDHFGKLFGSDLNRKDTIPYNEDIKQESPVNDVFVQIAGIQEIDLLNEFWNENPQYHGNTDFLKAMKERKTQLTNATATV